ncbi:uncharacterized protein LOC125537638 [Triticum urartu]|uniref:uncharacterized protein LOC125537631 n=1 Tax=Triticum urartu TaxID=4572 RepID=UPI002043E5FB|nr:uncharacterized protein LOC125537631 [Triticum urartu]XP_048556921.1 uncharacterized protein LOC125537638 [Triticum urartu]
MHDPFLRLTGPSRAIVSREPLNVEIELKVKGATKSEDKPLMSFFYYYSGSHCGICTLYIPLEGDFCTMALSSEEVYESVQATAVGIRVCVPEETPSIFKNGGRVVCSSLPRRRAKLPNPEHRTGPSFWQVVLQDGAMTSCSQGYLDLSRHVVSVKLCGTLEVLIEANSRSGAMAAQVSIQARDCNITQNECQLGDSKLEITVAWSRLVWDKLWITRGANEEL